MGDPTDFIVIPKIKVVYFSETPKGKRSQEGTLNITAHNLLFYSIVDTTFTLLYTLFEKIEKKVFQEGLRCQMLIKTKTFEEYKFEFPSQEEMSVVARSIEQLSNIQELMNIEIYFPFLYHPRNEVSCPVAYPWNSYSDVLSRWGCPSGKFIVSDINRKFTVCPTYPQEVIVPAICTTNNLIESAKFRHGSRFPIVAYYHKKTGASLLRAGQPLVGSLQKKCDSDKRILNACLVPRQRGRILDTRTKSNASQCVSKGGGTEQPGMYPHWLLEYCDLERPETMIDSYEKLFKLCHEPIKSVSEDHWFTGLGNTRWYSYVMAAMQSALKIAGFLQKDSSSVLIHGATGTDNTLLLSSLTQMILDPYTRRIEGFLELIIREWIFGGYPFRTRCMGLLETTKDKGRAPTFLLFLDCVWQLMRQYARSFEYKETLLILIHEHTHASEYGTFLANSMKERILHKLNENTYSLWGYVHSVRDSFINPMFEENLACLSPRTYPINILCWNRMYIRDALIEDEQLHLEVKMKELYANRDRLREKAQRLEDKFLWLKFQAEVLPTLDLGSDPATQTQTKTTTTTNNDKEETIASQTITEMAKLEISPKDRIETETKAPVNVTENQAKANTSNSQAITSTEVPETRTTTTTTTIEDKEVCKEGSEP